MRNEVQLITYANRFGGRTLGELHDLLKGPLKGVFGGVHLLPFYLRVDGADAGFDPIDHSQVDPNVGQWDDVMAITRDFDVMADVIVNHMSTESPQFRDFMRHGATSPHASLFLTRDTIFPQGASEQDLAAIYRPRPGLPFNSVTLQTGEQCSLWTTFTPQQVDIDVRHAQGRAYLEAILRKLSDSGIRMIRLDAVGYAIKRAGSSCFMIPETFEFIADLAAAARALGIEVLVEVHSYYRRQIEIAAHVDWVYDFALPPLILHAFAFKTALHLKEWIQVRPANALTVLDTHDGIGIIDIGPDPDDRIHHPGLVPPEELDRLVEIIHERSGGQSRQATGAAASNLDLYQVNSTFFDAMGRDERQYLLARAIQFFLPGVPQVYYVGLLAGGNDMDLLARTGVGRDINRHYYSRDEIERELRRPVVQDLLSLIRLRNTHPAFAGRFELEATTGNTLSLKWSNGEQFVRLCVDFVDSSYDLRSSQESECRLEAIDRRHSI
ncbi:MAG: sucrose phosphorylase [Steroidobacteraceae bacterium]